MQEKKLESCLLACTRMYDKHTAVNIEVYISQIISKFNLDGKLISVTTDNGFNVVKAVKDAGYQHIGCLAHRMNLVVTSTLEKMVELAPIRNKVSRIVALTKRSSNMKEAFMKIQRDLGQEPIMLIQDCPTRWNSLYLMIDRFLRLRNAVRQFLTTYSVQDSLGNISDEEWQMLEITRELLEPCYQFTVELSGEMFVTASKVIPLVKLLSRFFLKVIKEENNKRKSLPPGIEQSYRHKFVRIIQIVERMWTYNTNHILTMATLIDPRFKRIGFNCENDARKASSNLKKELTHAATSPSGASVASPDEEGPLTSRDAFWQEFDNDVDKARPSINNADEEFNQWFKEGLVDRKQDPIAWWCDIAHKSRFPNMFKLAMKYLPSQATSVPSERIFSTAGNVISELRSRLTDDNAEMLIFLHHNLRNIPTATAEGTSATTSRTTATATATSSQGCDTPFQVAVDLEEAENL